jgi:aspartyl protease family protein
MKHKAIIYILLLATILGFCSCNRRRSNDTPFQTNSSTSQTEQTERRNSTSRGKTIVKMEEQGGVYFVPCKINGSEMQFIFDTGASDITMSLTEAQFLYKQGKLKDDDFLGKEYYQIADGSVAEGTVINLQSVTIGDRTLNDVKASIVHNMEAPLLLGQSALAKFGKISIDYGKSEIIFE